jgi:hypothetical protein
MISGFWLMCDSMNRVKNLGFFMGIDLWVFVNMCVNDQLVEKYGNFVMLGLMVLV